MPLESSEYKSCTLTIGTERLSVLYSFKTLENGRPEYKIRPKSGVGIESEGTTLDEAIIAYAELMEIYEKQKRLRHNAQSAQYDAQAKQRAQGVEQIRARVTLRNGRTGKTGLDTGLGGNIPIMG